ncbi:hypothetical protein CZ787_06070 [Halomonas citrativorans]|uniref:Uncharacterized protein n=1 Tax=Halomonas citrativorans TaxID=2742612 RepID=A0A1R4HV78_9GAMM|nr:hypothetical protein CZ787_06070 [Halomonas citrativorans]
MVANIQAAGVASRGCRRLVSRLRYRALQFSYIVVEWFSVVRGKRSAPAAAARRKSSAPRCQS